MSQPQDFENKDHPFVTRMLDFALELADSTMNDAAYFLIRAAASMAFADHLMRQVVNTARFLGTNEYFREALELAGGEYGPDDFVTLAKDLTRIEIDHKVWWEQYQNSPAMQAAAYEVIDPKLDELERGREEHERRKAEAFAEAQSIRNRRIRDDDPPEPEA